LSEALSAARTHHALLIHGPAGVGQFELAALCAKAWLCESVTTPRPCDQCTSCRLMQARTHPDSLMLIPEALRDALGWDNSDAGDGEGDSSSSTRGKPSKDIRIDAVRSAVAFAQTTAARGRGKVVLIYPADRMNAIAANALLKTLEEPPGQARFVLATGCPQRLPPTVRSRCQALYLAAPSSDEAARWLASQGVDEPAVMLAATGGQPLEALTWAQDGVDAHALTNLPAAVMAADASALAGWPLPRAIDVLQKLCHDQMSLLVGAHARYFLNLTVARNASVAALHEWSKALARAARHAEHPLNAGLACESLVNQGKNACAEAGDEARGSGSIRYTARHG
jgi:DNA polymerase-3 subunit delta'